MELRYFLKCLVLPPLFQLVLFFVAGILWKRSHRLSCLLCSFAILSLFFLSCPFVATFLATALEKDPALSPQHLEELSADAIVILSGSQNDTAAEFGQPVSQAEALCRIRYGVFLQRKTGLPILVSGGSVYGHDQRSLAETMRYDIETLYGGTVHWLEQKSRTTAENAKNSYTILGAVGKVKILLVTSSIHMLRSKWSFNRAGFQVIAAPTDFIDVKPLNLLSFVPSSSSLALISRSLHEWFGFWTYHFFE